MEKIKFSIDDLKVESFGTSETQPVHRGTVKGMSIQFNAEQTTSTNNGSTCPPACPVNTYILNQTCQVTCSQNTCSY
jgi:hypothetical protein